MAKFFPGLSLKLRQAGIETTPELFVKKAIFAAFYMTTFIILFVGVILLKLKLLVHLLIILTPVVFLAMFFYFMKMSEASIARREKEIDREIVFAGRFLVIELESGVPLYNALNNVAKSYKIIGKAFQDITENIDLGSTTEEAIEDAINLTPSQDFRKILWQILNSLKTGSEVSASLNAVVDQITREQIIKMKEYGRKLNPIAMFYMMIAVILPSLGITMLIILTSFLAFELNLAILLFIAFFLAALQGLFIALIRSARPAVEL